MAKVLIEARTLGIGGGPAIYAEYLLRALVAQNPPHRVAVLVPSAGLAHFLYNTDFEILEAGWRWRGWQPLWDEVVVPRFAKQHGVDLVHMTKNAAPPRWGGKTAVTLHDVSPLVCPELSAPLERWYWSRQMRRIPHRADQVITVSATERQRISEVLGVDRETIAVTRLGVDPGFFAEPAAGHAAEVRRKYRLPARYLLNVGTISLKKNIPNLLAALQQLRDGGEEVPPLVIAGRPGPDCPTTWPDWVRVIPYVHHRELSVLYRNAEMFLFPSRFESFGLPLVEAMASGVPIVTSDCWSLPEIAGDAALQVAPDDVAGLAAAVKRLLTDEPVRRSLRERGLARAREFDWQHCARQTLEIYDRILKQNDRGAL